MMKRTKRNRVAAMIMALIMLLLSGTVNVFAHTASPSAMKSGENCITFTHVNELRENQKIEYEVTDANGNPAIISIERVSGDLAAERTASSQTDWKVSYTGIVINCYFYMTVKDNKVTSVYDEWILVIGGTYEDSELTKSTTYGKLSFKLQAYAGILGSTCWLKGVVTGTDNDITVSYQM